MTKFSITSGSVVDELHKLLDSILCISLGSQPKKREQLLSHFLRHELHGVVIGDISSVKWQELSNRCLFFACQEVLPVLTRRFLFHPDDRLLHEELNLYIQDKLLHNNFRRISSYDRKKTASFRTYIQHIIHNLALDFLRKRSRESKIIDSRFDIDSFANVYRLEQESLDQKQEEPLQQEPMQWLRNLLEQPEKTTDGSLQHRIAEHLFLEVRERLFLKAIYFAGLTAEEAGLLPGMNMNKNQANSLHRRLLDRLSDVFKAAGVYADLQQLVVTMDGLQEIEIDQLKARVAVTQLILVRKKTVFSDCLFAHQSIALTANISTDYIQLRKRLYSEMLDIRNHAIAGERFLESLDVKGKQLKLSLVAELQKVEPRYMKKIKTFFATQLVD